MKCPRCETAQLHEQTRDGIVIDVCAQCRGVWLDRGELERLVTRATQDMEQAAVARGGGRGGYEEQDDDRQEGLYSNRDAGNEDQDPRNPRRKRGWFESITDMFE